MSPLARMAIEKARRTCMPEEKFLSFWSMNCSSSANWTISSYMASISWLEKPRRAPFK